MATNFEPHECVIFVQSTKIGTHENKAIHSSFNEKTFKLEIHLCIQVSMQSPTTSIILLCFIIELK